MGQQVAISWRKFATNVYAIERRCIELHGVWAITVLVYYRNLANFRLEPLVTYMGLTGTKRLLR